MWCWVSRPEPCTPWTGFQGADGDPMAQMGPQSRVLDEDLCERNLQEGFPGKWVMKHMTWRRGGSRSGCLMQGDGPWEVWAHVPIRAVGPTLSSPFPRRLPEASHFRRRAGHQRHRAPGGQPRAGGGTAGPVTATGRRTWPRLGSECGLTVRLPLMCLLPERRRREGSREQAGLPHMPAIQGAFSRAEG